MVAVINGIVVSLALIVAAGVAWLKPGPRETRRKWGWGFRVGPLFFWRR